MDSLPLRQSLATLLAICLSVSALAKSNYQSAEEAAIRGLVDRYFAAYPTEDIEAIERLWSDKAADLAQAKARLKEFFSLNNQIETRDLQLRRLVVNAGRASALVTVEVSAIEKKTGKPTAGPGKMNRAMSFVKEAGEWKVWRDISAEEELAARLVAAQSDDERRALISEAPQLLTPELVRTLTAEGQKLYTRSNYPQALAILQLSYHIGEQIKDQTVTGRTLISLVMCTT